MLTEAFCLVLTVCCEPHEGDGNLVANEVETVLVAVSLKKK